MTRTIKNRPWSNAGVVMNDKLVRITANEDNGITIGGGGVNIQGPVNFVSAPNHIRISGLWTFNRATQLSLPSTMATPAPVLVQEEPTAQFESLIEDVGVMATLYASIVGGSV